ncbi:hypothetical protein [Streptomyces platensis]|uniref:hypothetical protein n=1 Tax=Streptomyces platensis TaxID=58346 RepID=UPI0037A987F6
MSGSVGGDLREPDELRALLDTPAADRLGAVATELDGRPRKTLDWEIPAERLHKLLAA